MNCSFYDPDKKHCTINEKECCLTQQSDPIGTRKCSTERISGLINNLKPKQAKRLATRFGSLMAKIQLS